MRKLGLILQSIKTKYKDSHYSGSDGLNNDSDEEDTDVIEGGDIVGVVGDQSSELSKFNKILKRHRKRFRQNFDRRHHR